MIKYNWYRSGAIFGMRYEMDAGSRLPMHSHESDTLHNVIVLSGHVRFDGETLSDLHAGDVFDFDGTKPHTIIAVQKSTILNLNLNGIPPGYAELPESEHSGVVP